MGLLEVYQYTFWGVGAVFAIVGIRWKNPLLITIGGVLLIIGSLYYWQLHPQH